MKTIYLLLLFKIVSADAQTILINTFTEKVTNTPIVELELKKEEVITIKNIFVFIDTTTLEQTYKIQSIGDLVKKNKVYNAVFYFINLETLKNNVSDETVYYALSAIQERKMMLDSNLYIFAHNDCLAYYRKIKLANDSLIEQKQVKKSFSGFLLDINDLLLNKSLTEIKKFVETFN